MAALSSFALSVLSIEQALDRSTITAPLVPRPRPSRRVTSNHNSFQTYCTADDNGPPSYGIATRQRIAAPRDTEGREQLPQYSCSVYAEAKVLLNLESINPMHSVSESEWREVYVVVQGTAMNVHRAKDGMMSKLLRSYTLQHAEIGLAADTTYETLVPNTKWAHLIPGPARQKAFKKDPRLFRAEKQYILRLRAETDQLLFAQPSEAACLDLINAISAAIDIAQPIDERSATRQCTVPRRRRRPRPQYNGDVNDVTLIADQERILREMYPSLAQAAQRDDDEVDVSAMREETREGVTSSAMREETRERERERYASSTQRPPISRSSTQNSIESQVDHDSVNFDKQGKWQPLHMRTEAQNLRYTRRCMPVLLAEAVRASDVLICDGRRVKINWRTESLDDWELKPPSYKSHNFPATKELETSSTLSESRTQEDEITPLETTISMDLAKGVSPNGLDKALRSKRSRRIEVDSMAAVQGIVYCF